MLSKGALNLTYGCCILKLIEMFLQRGGFCPRVVRTIVILLLN